MPARRAGLTGKPLAAPFICNQSARGILRRDDVPAQDLESCWAAAAFKSCTMAAFVVSCAGIVDNGPVRCSGDNQSRFQSFGARSVARPLA
jgi:hypothetical protein